MPEIRVGDESAAPISIHYRQSGGSPVPAGECPLLLPLVTADTVTSHLDWLVRRDGSISPFPTSRSRARRRGAAVPR